MADPAHMSQAPGATVRSLRGDAFALPGVQVLSHSDLRIATPRALRLPIAASLRAVRQVGLLDRPPLVSSFSFPRSSVPAAQVPRRQVPPPVAAAPERTAAVPPPAEASAPAASPQPTRIAPPGDAGWLRGCCGG